MLFAKDAAGSILVKKGKNKVTVEFDEKYVNKPIINVTLIAEGLVTENEELAKSGYSAIVSGVTTEGFTIILNKVAQEDIKFNWSAIQTGL